MTSHAVKIYERIIRKIIVRYLEFDNLLSHNQHGFGAGRSILTQLLTHFLDIYEYLTNDVDTDSIYLDYPKAFDKIDHRMGVPEVEDRGS